MARVTVTNRTTGTYLIPAPINKKQAAGTTKTYDGVVITSMERSAAFRAAIAHGSITVVVVEDPNVPNSIESSPMSQTPDYLASVGASVRTDEFTNPVAANNNAIKTSFATSAGIQSISGAALNGTVGAGEMIPPRNPTITSTSHANVTAVACVITGFVRNAAGALVPQTVTITTTNGGGATDAGDRALSFITSVTIPAMGGTAGALTIGFGPKIGLSALVKPRAGLIAPLREVAVGVVVTTGTCTNPTGAAVTLYAPASAPDGARDYAVRYESV